MPARNPYLDAIRAAAILLVMVHHLWCIPAPHPRWLALIAMRGYIGVDLFFVLSGWLIGGQLLRGFRRDGHLDVGRFWAKRWFRTLPAYYATLLLMSVVTLPPGTGLAVKLPDMLLFAQNYTSPLSWVLSWSLCIEEHFYLALPLVLLPLRGHPRLAVVVAGAALLVSPVLRWIAFDRMMAGSFMDYLATVYQPTHLRLEGLAIGVVFAALREYDTRAWRFCDAHRRAFAVAGVLLVLASSYNPWAYAWAAEDQMSFFAAVPAFLGVSLGTALVLPFAAAARGPATLWGSAATAIGEHAYALYLTHFAAFWLTLAALEKLGVTRLTYGGAVAAMLAGAAFAAVVLRQAVEKPGLRLREWALARQAPPASAPS